MEPIGTGLGLDGCPKLGFPSEFVEPASFKRWDISAGSRYRTNDITSRLRGDDLDVNAMLLQVPHVSERNIEQLEAEHSQRSWCYLIIRVGSFAAKSRRNQRNYGGPNDGTTKNDDFVMTEVHHEFL